MHLETLNEFDAAKLTADEWNQLLDCCSASHVPFLRHEYLETWWQTRGGGEWPDAHLHLVTARGEDGRLTGIAPLFFANHPDGSPSLLLVGSIEISDYLDLIVPEPNLPAFIEALFDHLSGANAPDQASIPAWKAIDLYNLPENSPTLAALQAAAESRGWVYSQERLQPCPVITLPGDWEAYLAGIDKKQRHEIRRKMRRAEEAAPPARWYIVDDAERLEAEMGEFMTLMAMDPAKERFLTPAMRDQLQRSARAAFDHGWLQLAFLEAGGRKAAAYLNFDYAGHIWVYNSGLNFELRELSPGWVLLGNLLRWAAENKRRAFDFMRGDEDYKYRFGGVNRYIVRATVTRTP